MSASITYRPALVTCLFNCRLQENLKTEFTIKITMNQGLFQTIFLTKYPSCAFKRTLKQFNVCRKGQSSRNRMMYLSTGITLYKQDYQTF